MIVISIVNNVKFPATSCPCTQKKYNNKLAQEWTLHETNFEFNAPDCSIHSTTDPIRLYALKCTKSQKWKLRKVRVKVFSVSENWWLYDLKEQRQTTLFET